MELVEYYCLWGIMILKCNILNSKNIRFYFADQQIKLFKLLNIKQGVTK